MGNYKIKYVLWKHIPIAVMAFLVPIVVRMNIVSLDRVTAQNWNGSNNNFDFFSYEKARIVIILTLISFVIFIFSLLYKNCRLKKTYIYIPMTLYLIFLFISLVFSKYRGIALWGFPDRYEGSLILISYMIITFICINIVDSEKSIKLIIYSVLSSALIIGLIGLFQYFDCDIFRTDFGKSIIIPYKYREYASKITFKFGKHIIYSSLYNPNYVGSYMSMIFPLSFVLFLFSKNRKESFILGLVSLLMLFNLIGCNSRAGIFGAFFAVLILLFTIRGDKIIFKRALKSIGITVFVAIFISLTIGNILLDKIFIKNIVYDKQPFRLKSIILKDNILSITTPDILIRVGFKDGDIVFMDESSNYIPMTIDKDTGDIIIKNKKYKPYKINIYNENKNKILSIKRSDFDIKFAIDKEKFRYFDSRGIIYDIKPVKVIGFKGRESLASTRGYIWSRSIPIIRNTLFLGYGADTFSIYFPQYDYVGKFNVYGSTSMIVDKPHSLYLNTAISTGLVSLVMLLLMFLIYFTCSINELKNINNMKEVYRLSIFIAFCGYIISSIFNDSVVSVSIVFWILFGSGIGLGNKLKVKN